MDSTDNLPSTSALMSDQSDKSDQDITILLLGETGVGKSTWINGFANFIQFASIDEAEKNDPLCLIPSSFTVTDDNYEERLVQTGSDKDEVMEVGQSATQYPRTYSFPQDGSTIRLIDTPGIGDVRGVEQDKKNFERILDHISHLNNLNAICILLKPNNARLNLMFSFCIKELLTHLHKDACRNIVFCFTNSRSTFYRPGDTLPALRKLLAENKDVEIPLNQSTLYCMDNEAIRFLYAVKAGVTFSIEERENFNASWNKSVKEIIRILEHAQSQEPHLIKHTISLNNARQTILALRNPMVEVSLGLQVNMASMRDKRNELTTSEKSKEELSRNLYVEEFDVERHVLLEPRTVCTSPKCVEVVRIGSGSITDTVYNTHCHVNCGTGKQKHHGIAFEVGHKNLRNCSAFDRDGLCKLCGCSWKHHMKTTYETKLVKRKVPDKLTEQEIQTKEDTIKKIQVFLADLDKSIKELEQEQAQITSVSAKFAQFLKYNAITPYNDSMLTYINHFIKQEENKVNQGEDSKVLESFRQMKIDYQNQKDVLDSAMKLDKSEQPITPTDLKKSINDLCSLRHSGKALVEVLEKSKQAAASNYVEKSIKRQDASATTDSMEGKGKKQKGNSIVSQIKNALMDRKTTTTKGKKGAENKVPSNKDRGKDGLKETQSPSKIEIHDDSKKQPLSVQNLSP